MTDVARLRSRRLELEKEIAARYSDQNRVYCQYIKPYAPSALMGVSATKRSRLSEVRTLTIQQADKLDRSTPTGAFEYGRAYVLHHSGEIRKLRTQLKKVEDELQGQRQNELLAKRHRDLAAESVEGHAFDLPRPLSEALRAFRALVRVRLDGGIVAA